MRIYNPLTNNHLNYNKDLILQEGKGKKGHMGGLMGRRIRVTKTLIHCFVYYVIEKVCCQVLVNSH